MEKAFTAFQAPPARAVLQDRVAPEDRVARTVPETQVAREGLEDWVAREGLEDLVARAVPAARVVPGDPEEDRVDPAGTSDPAVIA